MPDEREVQTVRRGVMDMLFNLALAAIGANLLVLVSTLIYLASPPPMWLLYPMPPLLLCLGILTVLDGACEFGRGFKRGWKRARE